MMRSLRGHPRVASGLLFLTLAAVTRVASYGKPLERDTANYLFVGRLLWHGTMPYKSAATNKAPLAYVFFGFVDLLAGPRVVLVRLTLLAFVVIASLAVAIYVERYAGRAAGIAAGSCLAALAAIYPLQGDDPNLSQYGIALMAGAWALATRPSRRAAAAAGVVLGLGVAANPLLGIVAPLVAWELLRSGPEDRVGRLVVAAAAGAAIVGAAVLFLLAGGAWSGFEQQVLHDDLFSRPGGTGLFDGHLTLHNAFDAPAGAVLWLGVVAALVAARRPALRAPALACLAWIALVWLKTEAQSYSFAHHFYLVMPAIAAAVGLALSTIWGPSASARIGLVAVVLAVPVATYVAGPQFRKLAVSAPYRWEVDGEAGPSWRLARPVSDFIAAHTKDSDRIFMVGADPEVYWLAGRRAPTRYFDYYLPLRDAGAAAERMRALEHHPPAAIGALPDGDANADLPAIQPFIDAHGYRLAFDQEGAKVWLRPDAGAA